MTMDFSDPDDDGADATGRRISRDDLHDLAKVGGDLFRKTILSGFEIFRDASKDLPKEASQFISARKEQVFRNMSRDLAQAMIHSAFENFFSLVRQHRLDVSVRIVRIADQGEDGGEKPGQRTHDNASVARPADQAASGSNRNNPRASGRRSSGRVGEHAGDKKGRRRGH
jgi:hypothetical protein